MHVSGTARKGFAPEKKPGVLPPRYQMGRAHGFLVAVVDIAYSTMGYVGTDTPLRWGGGRWLLAYACMYEKGPERGSPVTGVIPPELACPATGEDIHLNFFAGSLEEGSGHSRFLSR